jgi:hypothetical protein
MTGDVKVGKIKLSLEMTWTEAQALSNLLEGLSHARGWPCAWPEYHEMLTSLNDVLQAKVPAHDRISTGHSGYCIQVEWMPLELR